jgi:UDP-N-acetylmuramoyl-tripeptide--D-alanyl-D-alanine ligase
MSVYGYLLVIGYLALLSLAVMLAAQPLVHVFQLESYKRRQFFLRLNEDKSIKKGLGRVWLVSMLAQAGLALAAIVLLFITSDMQAVIGDFASMRPRDVWVAVMAFTLLSALLAGLVFLIALVVHFIRWKRQPSKKPLKVTARVIRLNVMLFFVLALAQAIGVLYIFLMAGYLLFPLFYYVFASAAGSPIMNSAVRIELAVLFAALAALNAFVQYVTASMLPRLLALASVLVQPVEAAVKKRYFNDARRKLAGFPDMVKIGITGSFGKTSAKVILATILSEKYKTYATLHSYNTPMGVTRAIREQLDNSYGVFIAEMGARQPGDISEMCRLVSPRYGLLTGVGAQHLETFKTLENVAKTKYELIEALPQDGMAFFPCDNAICLELYRKTSKPKALFGIGEYGEPLYMSAQGILSGPAGSSFTLIGPDGETAPCITKLLGAHNVQNILGAAAVAHALGLSLEEIARGVAGVEPVEHRLQLVPTGNGITVIDDAFNSNPAGTRAALEVLMSFPGRKIVVTPGLVELGEAEAAENEAFGRAMAEVVDIAILVARNSVAMKKGLLDAGFSEENIIVTGKLAEATEVMGKLTRVGDVVLFENDLPDHYEV